MYFDRIFHYFNMAWKVLLSAHRLIYLHSKELVKQSIIKMKINRTKIIAWEHNKYKCECNCTINMPSAKHKEKKYTDDHHLFPDAQVFHTIMHMIYS